MTNKGNNIKKKGDAGWEDSFKWNKYLDKCGTVATLEGERYLISSYHKSVTNEDKISLVSTSKAKNTGLMNGQNHLKCFFTTGNQMVTSKTTAKLWMPKFDSDEGQSLVNWSHTGTAQIVHLKDSHKRIPSGFTYPSTQPQSPSNSDSLKSFAKNFKTP